MLWMFSLYHSRIGKEGVRGMSKIVLTEEQYDYVYVEGDDVQFFEHSIHIQSHGDPVYIRGRKKYRIQHGAYFHVPCILSASGDVENVKVHLYFETMQGKKEKQTAYKDHVFLESDKEYVQFEIEIPKHASVDLYALHSPLFPLYDIELAAQRYGQKGYQFSDIEFDPIDERYGALLDDLNYEAYAELISSKSCEEMEHIITTLSDCNVYLNFYDKRPLTQRNTEEAKEYLKNRLNHFLKYQNESEHTFQYDIPDRIGLRIRVLLRILSMFFDTPNIFESLHRYVRQHIVRLCKDEEPSLIGAASLMMYTELFKEDEEYDYIMRHSKTMIEVYTTIFIEKNGQIRTRDPLTQLYAADAIQYIVRTSEGRLAHQVILKNVATMMEMMATQIVTYRGNFRYDRDHAMYHYRYANQRAKVSTEQSIVYDGLVAYTSVKNEVRTLDDFREGFHIDISYPHTFLEIAAKFQDHEQVIFQLEKAISPEDDGKIFYRGTSSSTQVRVIRKNYAQYVQIEYRIQSKQSSYIELTGEIGTHLEMNKQHIDIKRGPTLLATVEVASMHPYEVVQKENRMRIALGTKGVIAFRARKI